MHMSQKNYNANHNPFANDLGFVFFVFGGVGLNPHLKKHFNRLAALNCLQNFKSVRNARYYYSLDPPRALTECSSMSKALVSRDHRINS